MANYKSSLSTHLESATYVLALLGAGLSAPSGIPTFRGLDRKWRGLEPQQLSTRAKFEEDPLLVWAYFEDRRRQALASSPNNGHAALARLASMKHNFLAVTQNIDGFSQRAGHNPTKLIELHGSLFDATCFQRTCSFKQSIDDDGELMKRLGLPSSNLSNPSTIIPKKAWADMPWCPECKAAPLRPGVVWFGEHIPKLDAVEQWLESVPRIDIMLVVGTSLRVFPATEYLQKAREKGAVIAHFNTVRDDDYVQSDDWFVAGDASMSLPMIVGDCMTPETAKYHRELLSSGLFNPTEDLRRWILQCCSAAQRHMLTGPNAYPEVVKIGPLAVKFGYAVSEFEACNQREALALVDPAIVKIPQVHSYFNFDGMGYLVMEYVHGQSLTELDVQCASKLLLIASNHLHSIKRSYPGPLTPGPLRGLLWDHDQETKIDSAEELQRYLNSRIPGSSTAIDISNRDYILCHLDLAPRNSILASDGTLCLLDWQSAGFYPRTFERCAIRLNYGPNLETLGYSNVMDHQMGIHEPLTDDEEHQAALVQEFVGNTITYSLYVRLHVQEQR